MRSTRGGRGRGWAGCGWVWAACKNDSTSKKLRTVITYCTKRPVQIRLGALLQSFATPVLCSTPRARPRARRAAAACAAASPRRRRHARSTHVPFPLHKGGGGHGSGGGWCAPLAGSTVWAVRTTQTMRAMARKARRRHGRRLHGVSHGARMPARETKGSCHPGGKPMSTADAATVGHSAPRHTLAVAPDQWLRRRP